MTTDAELAIRAAAAGAEIVRSLFGRPLERMAKEGNDFATEADLASERAIRDILRAARPDDGFLGEEFGASGSGSARRWLVDPLCGTHNYAAGTPLVAVNVSLSVDTEIVAAAAADPFSGEIFWTDGVSAQVRLAGRDQPLKPDSAIRIVDLNVDPPFPNGDRFRAASMIADDAFSTVFRTRVMSSTLALAWVAAGRYAGYITDGDLRDSLHFSPGIALCKAAGCVVTGLAGQPLHTGMHGLVAAADPATHAELLGIVARQWS